jgi:hypothetical protein
MPEFFRLTQVLHVERPSFQLLGRPCVFNLLYRISWFRFWLGSQEQLRSSVLGHWFFLPFKVPVFMELSPSVW